ncbi:Uncharacterised protein [Mycobacterium tuberculosis]|uniref:Uncharacterized protein n=1 Tax=Mycobacterium tuberculosis TaxID=1773 RepID=A0A0T9EAF1_MYCTX|nr:Uncharacterised protein [Mycobacterium tuberculosis]CFE63009.1 Uncharacterised protein [Mycobacterium tuberculosis]CKS97753.1 Uncharacterised protein [Mycobacterium tuberculosis]CKS97889.1 Uncharacterised protein [Mycobacterium tuberculosis]CKT49807.1 Uncharacterised protein [Mycobacterium tuberculosis]
MNLTEFGFGAGRDDDPGAMARGYQCAGIRDIATISDRCALRQRHLVLVNRRRLAGKC